MLSKHSTKAGSRDKSRQKIESDSPQQGPSTVYARRPISVFFIMHGLCFASWASRIPTIQAALGLSASGLGTILFALPAGFFVALPLSGWLIEKAGSRKVVVPASVLYALSLVCIGGSGTSVALAGSLFAFGVFANLLNIAMNTQAVMVEALYQKRLMAAFHGLWSLAGFAGAAAGSWMMAIGVAPLYHFALVSLIFIITAGLAGLCLIGKDTGVTEKRQLFIMPGKSLLLLGLIAFCSMMAEGAMFDWSGVYFATVVNAPAWQAGWGYSIFMIAMAAMRFMADGLAERFGLKLILQASGLLTTVGLLLAVAFPVITPSLLGFFLVGLGVSSVVPLVYSAAGRSNTLSPGSAITAVSSLGFFGFLLGPPIIGFIAEEFGLRISFLAISAMSIAVVVFSARVQGSSRSS